MGNKNNNNLTIRFILFIVIQMSIFSSSNKSYAQEVKYEIVKIGSKFWMTQNLAVTKFRNGDPIRQVKTPDEWNEAYKKKEPVWMYYENNPSYGKKYGKIYNYYAITDNRVLAPEGYHIPSNDEWEIITQLPSVAVKSKSEWFIFKYRCKILQNFTNYTREGIPFTDLGYVDSECQRGGSGNNESGFNAWPSGRIGPFGFSEFLTKEVGYWSSTSGGEWNYPPFGNAHWLIKFIWDENKATLVKAGSTQGFYVRCISEKTEQEFQKEMAIIKAREDSIIRVKTHEEIKRKRTIDSLNLIKQNKIDSINVSKTKLIIKKYKFSEESIFSGNKIDLSDTKKHIKFQNEFLNETFNQSNYDQTLNQQLQIHKKIDTLIKFYNDLKKIYGPSYTNYNFYIGRQYHNKIIYFSKNIYIDYVNNKIVDPMNYKKNKDSAYYFLNKHLEFDSLHIASMNRLSTLVWYDNIWRQVVKNAAFDKEVYVKSLIYLIDNVSRILNNNDPDYEKSIDEIYEITGQMIIDQIGDFNYSSNEYNKINLTYILGKIINRIKNIDSYKFFEMEKYKENESLINRKIEYANRNKTIQN